MSVSTDQHNRGGLIAFLFSMVFVGAFFIWLVAIHPGVVMDEKVVDPNAKVETKAEDTFNVDKVAEPWVSSEPMVAYGKKVYQTNCSTCHGAEGKGDGVAGAALNPKPRNLVEGKWTQGNGVIAHFNVLTNGIKGSSMPPWGHFKPADRWALVHFIESITTNKSKDEPLKVAEFAKTAK